MRAEKSRKLWVLVAILASFSLLWSAKAHSANFPNRFVRVVIPFAADRPSVGGDEGPRQVEAGEQRRARRVRNARVWPDCAQNHGRYGLRAEQRQILSCRRLDKLSLLLTRRA